MDTTSAIAALRRWAEPEPEMGPAILRLTRPPLEHKHAYHVYCPWSSDGRWLTFLRYDRVHPAGEVCVMDPLDGSVRVVGRTRQWGGHNAARQQWQGGHNRIVYFSADAGDDDTSSTFGSEGAEEVGPFAITVNADGSDARRTRIGSLTAPFCAPDGRWVYGGMPLQELFPGDAITPRHDKGLIRVDLETGRRELVLSIERALALLPNAAEAQRCHLYVKMIIAHPAGKRVLFNLTNTFWDIDGKEPTIRCIISVGPDGSAPAYVGRIAHHPNWHPLDDRIVANVKDAAGVMRFGLYAGAGGAAPSYVPGTPGSGHPSYSPDGRWLCTDAAGPEGDQMILCDPLTGRSKVVAVFHRCGGGGYRSFDAIRRRRPGETVMDALVRAATPESQTWQTQAHPAWSRDGSAILFTWDSGEGAQMYVVDVPRALEAG